MNVTGKSRARRQWLGAVWIATACAVLFAYGRSYRVGERVTFEYLPSAPTETSYMCLSTASSAGHVELRYYTNSYAGDLRAPSGLDSGWHVDFVRYSPSQPVQATRQVERVVRLDRFGFTIHSMDFDGRGLTLVLPHWFLVVLLGLPVVPRMLRTVRGACRRHRSLCPTCGYDLRATPTRCPECGTVVQRPPASPDHPAHAPRDRDPSGAAP